jgi:RNA polymerase sigma-54 factor
MKASLQFRLSQHLALTPQLQQSIRLLQLSTLELNQEVEQALADNPLLERDDDPLAGAMRVASDGAILGDRPGSPNDGASPGERDGDGEARADRTDADARKDAGEAADGADGGGDGESDPGSGTLVDWGAGTGGTGGDRDDDEGPLAWAATTTTLAAHLRDQLSTTRATRRDRALVEMLIETLDDNGFLTASLDEVLQMCPPEVDVEPGELTAALRLLQSFEPTGVGARGAAECLALQIDARRAALGSDAQRQSAAVQALGATLDLARRIVSEHLPLLAARDFARLRKALNATDDALRDAHQLIRGLNPRPGVGFASNAADYVVPDIFVRRVKGRWQAQLNPGVMPQLRINQAYAAILKRERSKEGSPWSARLQEARWLIRNLQQRFDTILRVSQAIVDRQHNFFSHGAIAMRPLVLREIADTVSLHESTISRVTASKYMATPFGVFELKFFFGSHVATEAGGAASSTAIRALIKQLIGAEDPRNPLSDSRLAELLGEQGIVVARRTVAKYRELLQIPPVAMRKVL